MAVCQPDAGQVDVLRVRAYQPSRQAVPPLGHLCEMGTRRCLRQSRRINILRRHGESPTPGMLAWRRVRTPWAKELWWTLYCTNYDSALPSLFRPAWWNLREASPALLAGRTRGSDYVIMTA